MTVEITPDDAFPWLRSLEYGLAWRLNCLAPNPETWVIEPRVHTRTDLLDELINAYGKECTTQPRSLFVTVEPNADATVRAEYALPLAAMGRENKVVSATYDYYRGVYVARNKTTSPTLRRRKVGKIGLGANQFHTPREADPTVVPKSFNASQVLGAAVSAGRAGGYRT